MKQLSCMDLLPGYRDYKVCKDVESQGPFKSFLLYTVTSRYAIANNSVYGLLVGIECLLKMYIIKLQEKQNIRMKTLCIIMAKTSSTKKVSFSPGGLDISGQILHLEKNDKQ